MWHIIIGMCALWAEGNWVFQHFIFTARRNTDSDTYGTPAPLFQTFGPLHNKRSLLRWFRINPRLLLLLPRSRHTSPETAILIVSEMWLLIFLAWLVIWVGGTYWYLFGKRSPFSLESVRPPGPREFDQKKRDKVIKQGKVVGEYNQLRISWAWWSL